MGHWNDVLTDHAAVIKQQLIKDDEGYVLHSSQDCGPILDEIQRMRSQGQRPGTHGGYAASVPANLYWVVWPEEFKKKYGFHPRRPPPAVKAEDAEKLWRNFFVAKLHDREYSKLRIDQRRFTAEG